MKKYTRRFLAIILSIGFILAMAGCGNGTADTSEITTTEAVESEADVAEDDTTEVDNTEERVAASETDVAEENTDTISGDKVELVILAAASLTDVCDELKGVYEAANPNVTLTFSYAGSGALQTQIEEGAPADIFISAAQKQMNALKEESLMKDDSVTDLLENKVVLVVPAEGGAELSDFADVKGDNVKLIGIGDVESVPAGQYAQTIFTNMGIWEDVEKKANFGTDVRTVLGWVETSAVDCGVVYATDAYTSDKVKIVAEAPEGTCDKVIYPAGIVAATKNEAAAEDFMNFLKSEETMKIFEKYGFIKAE